MARFRSKLVEIDAVQLTDAYILQAFGDEGDASIVPPGLKFDGWANRKTEEHAGLALCKTRNGEVVAEVGDWIITESDGSGCYPCKADVFNSRWEPVDGDAPPA